MTKRGRPNELLTTDGTKCCVAPKFCQLIARKRGQTATEKSATVITLGIKVEPVWVRECTPLFLHRVRVGNIFLNKKFIYIILPNVGKAVYTP